MHRGIGAIMSYLHLDLMAGLQYYAGAGDDVEQGYANKVIAEKLRLEQAARRKNAPDVWGEERIGYPKS